MFGFFNSAARIRLTAAEKRIADLESLIEELVERLDNVDKEISDIDIDGAIEKAIDDVDFDDKARDAIESMMDRAQINIRFY